VITWFRRLVHILLLGQVLRHAAILMAHFRVRRFLEATALSTSDLDGFTANEDGTKCYVVVPLLREQDILEQSVAHFLSLLDGIDGCLVLVTTDREHAEMPENSERETTPIMAARFANGQNVLHLHYPGPDGYKGDQLNFAAEAIARTRVGDDLHEIMIMIYDADSRPPRNSLRVLLGEVANHDDVPIFHQSARFELRRHRTRSILDAIAGAGALRANRFVVSYEIPRLLNRSPGAGPMRRTLSLVTYGHVTGHGLAIRLDWLLECPMPAKTQMEDMHYSYILAVGKTPVVPLRNLDCCGVPPSLSEQFKQAERWFQGPGRVLRYRNDERAMRGAVREAVTVSALLICAEWLSCSVAVPSLLAGLASKDRLTRSLAATFVGIYSLELLSTELLMNGRHTPRASLARFAAFPVANTLFGIAGLSSITKSCLGRSVSVKTEQ